MDLSWGGIILFLAFVAVSYLSSVVNRRNIDTNAEQVKNEAVGLVNEVAKDALGDLRAATQMLLSEGEKRARLEGQVGQLVNQLNEERRRADSASLKSSHQDEQITKLYNQVQVVDETLKAVKTQLTRVQREKAELETTLADERQAYEELMTSIEHRIEQAVSDVRDQMQHHYESKIAQLEQQIRNKDLEIEQLKSKIQEETHHEEPTITPQPITTADDATITKPDSSSSN